MPPCLGFAEFVLRAKEFGIKLVSTSDADNTSLLIDLADTFEGRVPFGSEIFDKCYRLSMIPKGYSKLLADFVIKPEELLIIGNDEYKDLSGAPTSANKILVPTYRGLNNNFDFSGLVIP
jgi:hypothetical protein